MKIDKSDRGGEYYEKYNERRQCSYQFTKFFKRCAIVLQKKTHLYFNGYIY